MPCDYAEVLATDEKAGIPELQPEEQANGMPISFVTCAQGFLAFLSPSGRRRWSPDQVSVAARTVCA
jgi:hypothetical protein